MHLLNRLFWPCSSCRVCCFGFLKGVSKSGQVLFSGTEAVLEPDVDISEIASHVLPAQVPAASLEAWGLEVWGLWAEGFENNSFFLYCMVCSTIGCTSTKDLHSHIPKKPCRNFR